MVPATAGAGLANTQVTIKVKNTEFFGKVTASDASCITNRNVKVKKVKPGKNETIASDTTNRDGEWNTGNTGQNRGEFYAKAPRDGECDPGKSKTITL